MIPFPDYEDSAAAPRIRDLERLMDRTLTNTKYIDGMSASRLLGALFIAYKELNSQGEKGPLGSDPRLRSARESGQLFGFLLAAAFDLVCNAEYVHGRLVNSRWIYCHREGDSPRAYYSFLKQCPACCLDHGLEGRISGAQHKPTSHHIGEITTVAISLLMQLIAAANEEPFEIAIITKQSHDADAIGFRKDLLVLFEIKASPMVSFPIVMELPEPLFRDTDNGTEEYAQHSLVDLVVSGQELSLDIPHRGWSIPLGSRTMDSWPYDGLIDFFSDSENFATFLSAWIELFEAYRIPKTAREGRAARLAYLVNGWGDEIDSNKTKPGLGRTDDIKKGTYQLLKFGAYYRDDSSNTTVRGALVANLDPLFLRSGYIDKLADVRWGHENDFHFEDGEYRIAPESLRHLYDGILSFNDPLLNDPTLQDIFNLAEVERSLTSGALDRLIEIWCEKGPDEVVEAIGD